MKIGVSLLRQKFGVAYFEPDECNFGCMQCVCNLLFRLACFSRVSSSWAVLPVPFHFSCSTCAFLFGILLNLVWLPSVWVATKLLALHSHPQRESTCKCYLAAACLVMVWKWPLLLFAVFTGSVACGDWCFIWGCSCMLLLPSPAATNTETWVWLAKGPPILLLSLQQKCSAKLWNDNLAGCWFEVQYKNWAVLSVGMMVPVTVAAEAVTCNIWAGHTGTEAYNTPERRQTTHTHTLHNIRTHTLSLSC